MKKQPPPEINLKGKKRKGSPLKFGLGCLAGTAEYVGIAGLLQKTGCDIAIHPGQLTPSNALGSAGLFSILQVANAFQAGYNSVMDEEF